MEKMIIALFIFVGVMFITSVDWLGDRIELKTVTQITAQMPDGKIVMEDQQEAVHGEAVDISMEHQQYPPGILNTPNHSSIINREQVSIPVGQATLLTIEQDNFTAVTEHEPGARTDTVYWLYVTKPNLDEPELVDTYILLGVVTGNAAAAKEELLETANTWNPPIK